MVTRLQRGDQERVATGASVPAPGRGRDRGRHRGADPGHDGGLETLRWLLRQPEPEGGGRPGPPGRARRAQDDARRRDLEALEDLDVAADLDGTVQVLLDAGVRCSAWTGSA